MATPIDPALAKSLIQEYQNQNAAAGGPAIKTHEGHPLHGYFLDRESLESILSNPKVVGVSLHLAKHPDFQGAESNHFTLIYAGAEPNVEPNAATPYVTSGALFDNIPPCPPMCTVVK